MFTGIIESVGILKSLSREGENIDLVIESLISNQLSIDQSVSHNGVCLTVTKSGAGMHGVTAVDETLRKSNFGKLAAGDPVNLERSMLATSRFDGHIVQGHVDQVATCANIVEKKGSWLIQFEFTPPSRLIVEKGSVAVNGVSLTCFDVTDRGFAVEIIPFTFEHTTFRDLKSGHVVNLEFDIIGKYVQRLLSK